MDSIVGQSFPKSVPSGLSDITRSNLTRSDESEINLRMLTEEDAGSLWDLIITDRVSPKRKTIWPGLESESDLDNYISTLYKNKIGFPSEIVYLILKGQEFLGTLHLHSMQPADYKLEVGYWVHHSYEGKGYASQAVAMIEPVIESLGFHRIEIRCDSKNQSSCRVAEKNKFHKDGVLIEDSYQGTGFVDTVIYGKILGRR